MFEPTESVTDGGPADRFDIGGREPGQAFGDGTDRHVQMDAIQVLAKQSLAVCRVRCRRVAYRVC